MNNFGDFFRAGMRVVDELLIDIKGRSLIYCELDKNGQFDSKGFISLIGIYEIPSGYVSHLGHSNDEMIVELGYNSTINKMETLPKIDGIIIDCLNQKWRIKQRNRKDNMVYGIHRIVLNTVRHHEARYGSS